MQIFFPQDLPDPGPFASKDDWAAYYAQMWPAYSAFMQNSAASELTNYRNQMVGYRKRQVESEETTHDKQRELFTKTIEQLAYEKSLGELRLIAELVEARATDRTASGAIDKVKVMKDVREILEMAKAIQAEQAQSTADTPPVLPSGLT